MKSVLDIPEVEQKQAKTRERVLDSACKIFAEKGFRETTVAEICQAAGANIAAVNYYFNSKDELYHAVWRRASECSEAGYRFTEEDLRTPAAWLRAHVRNRVLSIFDAGPAGWFPRLLQLEMADPTPMGDALRETFLMPRMQQTEAHMRELLGDAATEEQLRCCVINIVSLHAFLNLGKLARRRLFHDQAPSEAQLNAIISQMQTFALAGVAGVRTAIAAQGAA